MTVLPQHTQRIIFHKAMASAHLIAAEFDCSASDVIDIVVGSLLTTDIGKPISTPSQPKVPTHAPAAQTDGAAGVLPDEPSVDLSGLAAHEQGPTPSPAVPPAGDAADGRAETLLSKSSVATKPQKKGPSLSDRVHACYDEHPDWTNGRIAAHVGCSHSTVSTWLAPRRREAKARIAEALKAPAKPQEALEPPPAPKVQPPPEQPPAAIPVVRSLPLPPPVVKPMQKGPQGRFYLKERTEIGKPNRWVHQSLQACPTGPGPLMTLDRKWAWYDTMERFKGAVKLWPELNDMVKQAVTT